MTTESVNMLAHRVQEIENIRKQHNDVKERLSQAQQENVDMKVRLETVSNTLVQSEQVIVALLNRLEEREQEVKLLQSEKQIIKDELDFTQRFLELFVNEADRSKWLVIKHAKSLSGILTDWLNEQKNGSLRHAFVTLRKIVEMHNTLLKGRKEAVAHFLAANINQYRDQIDKVKQIEQQLEAACHNTEAIIDAATNAVDKRKQYFIKLSDALAHSGLKRTSLPSEAASRTLSSKKELKKILTGVNEWITAFEKVCGSGKIADLEPLICDDEQLTRLLERVSVVLQREQKHLPTELWLNKLVDEYRQVQHELVFIKDQRRISPGLIEKLTELEKQLQDSEMAEIDAKYNLEKAVRLKASNVENLRKQFNDAAQLRILSRGAVYECRRQIRHIALSTLPELLIQDDDLKLQVVELGKDCELELEEQLSDYKIEVVFTANVTKRTLMGSDKTFVFKRLVVSPGIKIDKEIRLLKKLKNEHIGELLNVIRASDSSDIFLKMPFYSEGTLEFYLKQNPNESDKKEIFRQVLKGLEFIHSQNVVHLDIKPSNVVLQRYGNRLNARIIDFGISKDLNQTTTKRTLSGTRGYMPPEIEQGQRVGVGADLWSFGVMLWEAFLSTPIAVLKHTPNGEPLLPAGCELKLSSLLLRLLHKEPRSRGSASYHLIHSEFFVSEASRPTSDNLQIAVQQVRYQVEDMWGYSDLPILVSRQSLVSDAISFFADQCDEETMWEVLRVEFDGEQGTDAGGLQREFYTMFFSKIVQPGGYFEGDDSFLPLTDNELPSDHERIYESIGKIMGKAIVDGDVAGVHFAKPLFKFFLGEEQSLNLEDLYDFSPQVARSVLTVEHSTEEELNELGIDGVTLSNRKQFMTDKCLDLIRTRRIACEALKRGFDLFLNRLLIAMASLNLKQYVKSDVLQALLVGNIELDAETMAPHLMFDSWEGSQTPNLLLDWLHGLNSQQLKNFWRFCTGSTAFMIGSTEFVTITRTADDNREMLPVAHTCTKILVIPDYGDANLLAKKMQHSLVEVEFGLC